MAIDQLRIGCGYSAMDLGVARLHDLCLEGRQLRQDLRLAWRRYHSAALFYLTAYVILARAVLNAEIERQTILAKRDPIRRARSIRNGSDSDRAEARR
jgi:hypothetical protein